MKTKILHSGISMIALSVLVLLQGCGSQSEKSTNVENEAVVVSAAKAEKMIYTPELQFSGIAKANRDASLSTALPGRIESLKVTKGAHVAKGQLVAELSDELLIQAVVTYETLKTDFERLTRLLAKGSVSQVDFDHLKAKFEAAEARKNLMEKNTRLHAPFAGVIAAVYFEEGENYSLLPSGISSNMELENGIVKLINYDPLKITISVNEKTLVQIHKGQEAELRFDAFPDTVFQGKVNYIGEELSTMTHSAEVELLMKNPDLLVKPGMFAHVSLQQKPMEAIFVPINSVQRQSGTAKDFVYVVRDNSARRMEVEKGAMLGDKVSVSGLRGDETVVVSGKSRLTDGAKVQIK